MWCSTGTATAAPHSVHRTSTEYWLSITVSASSPLRVVTEVSGLRAAGGAGRGSAATCSKCRSIETSRASGLSGVVTIAQAPPTSMDGTYIHGSPALPARIRLAWANITPSTTSRVLRPAAARPAPGSAVLTPMTVHGEGSLGRRYTAARAAAAGGASRATTTQVPVTTAPERAAPPWPGLSGSAPPGRCPRGRRKGRRGRPGGG